MNNSCRVGLGLPIYNEIKYLKEAIESILAQTYCDFTLCVMDECSTDGTSEALLEYARKDKRVVYHRNSKRNGIVRNWYDTFYKVYESCPNVKYFAWVSGHDVWDPKWLEIMFNEIDKNEDLVLVYPKIKTIGSSSDAYKNSRFQTAGIKDPIKRFKYTNRNLKGAGNMVYGLFRAEALKRAGVFRPVLLPDRFLLLELSLYGEYKYVDYILWSRRLPKHEKHNNMIRKQRRRSFSDDGAPLYIYLPWYVIMTLSFMKTYCIKSPSYFNYKRHIFVNLAFQVLFVQSTYNLRKLTGKLYSKCGMKWIWKRMLQFKTSSINKINLVKKRITKLLKMNLHRFKKRCINIASKLNK